MKNILIILVLTLFIITSCNKDEENQLNYYRYESNGKVVTREINSATIKNNEDTLFILSFISDETSLYDKYKFRFNLYPSNQNISGTYLFSELGESSTFDGCKIRYYYYSTGSHYVIGSSSTQFESGTITIILSNNIYEINFEVDYYEGYYKGSLEQLVKK